MRRHLRSKNFIAFLLACSLLFTSCKEKPDPNLTAFREAVAQNRFDKAGTILEWAEFDKDFVAEPYIEVVRSSAQTLAKQHENGEKTYDEVLVQLQAMEVFQSLDESILKDLEEAKKTLYPDNFIEQSLKHAELFAEAGDDAASMEILNKILADFPKNVQAEKQKAAVLGDYIDKTNKEVETLLAEGYPRFALLKVERALRFASDNKALLNLQVDLKNRIHDIDAAVQDAVPRFELTQYYESGDLLGAQSYITKLSQLGRNVTNFQKDLDAKVEAYITSVLDDAAYLAQSTEGRWEVSPYGSAIAKIQEGLAAYPQNLALQDAANYYKSLNPVNAASFIQVLSGSVSTDAVGKTADGYEYKSGQFNRPVKFRPDAEFSYSTNGAKTAKIYISPESADKDVYQNMVMEITVNGTSVYSGKPFESGVSPLDLSVELSGDSTVQIKVSQSGFASFFEKILGRNSMYAELFLLP